MQRGKDAELEFKDAVRPALLAYTAPISMWEALEVDVADWKKVIGAVAPALATALGGPLAGVAVKAIAGKLLGKENASEEEVASAVLALPPDALVKLKEAEYDFLKSMKEADIKLEEVHQRDRDSARTREAAVKDIVPGILACMVVVGFGATLATLLSSESPPPPEMREALLVLLGSLSAALAQVLAYYFGSSSGSKAKTEALERVSKG